MKHHLHFKYFKDFVRFISEEPQRPLFFANAEAITAIYDSGGTANYPIRYTPEVEALKMVCEFPASTETLLSQLGKSRKTAPIVDALEHGRLSVNIRVDVFADETLTDIVNTKPQRLQIGIQYPNALRSHPLITVRNEDWEYWLDDQITFIANYLGNLQHAPTDGDVWAAPFVYDGHAVPMAIGD